MPDEKLAELVALLKDIVDQATAVPADATTTWQRTRRAIAEITTDESRATWLVQLDALDATQLVIVRKPDMSAGSLPADVSSLEVTVPIERVATSDFGAAITRIAEAQNLLALSGLRGLQQAWIPTRAKLRTDLIRYRIKDDSTGEVIANPGQLNLKSGEFVAVRITNESTLSVNLTLLHVTDKLTVVPLIQETKDSAPQGAKTGSRRAFDSTLPVRQVGLERDVFRPSLVLPSGGVALSERIPVATKQHWDSQHVVAIGAISTGTEQNFLFLSRNQNWSAIDRRKQPAIEQHTLDSPLGKWLQTTVLGVGDTTGLPVSDLSELSMVRLSWQLPQESP